MRLPALAAALSGKPRSSFRLMSSQAQVIAVDKPLVSVVMPVHNGERFLDEAIWSIRNHNLTQL